MRIKSNLVMAIAALSLFGCATTLPSPSAMTERDPVQIDEANPPAIMELHFDSYGEKHQ